MNFTIVILSCDKYMDILPLFFKQFQENYPEYNKEIYLCTESNDKDELKRLKVKYNVQLPQKNSRLGMDWGERFRNCLIEIKTENVLVILDDFILTEKVDHEVVLKADQWLTSNKNIACFNFQTTKYKGEKTTYPGFEKKNRFSKFRVNLQSALWNKSFLVDFIRKHEGPWQFETWGSLRSAKSNKEFLHLESNRKPVFTYPVGGIIADGRWRDLKSVELINSLGFSEIVKNRTVYYPGNPRKTEISKRSKLKKLIQVIRSLI